MTRRLLPLSFLVIVALILATIFLSMAASNAVPRSGVSQHVRPITANDVKPVECAGLSLTNKLSGSGTFSGTSANNLILGSAGVDTISGLDGNDCILGGGGNDTLNGNGNNDVILGGAGNDALNGGANTDTCHGESGTDTFTNCETQIQ